MTLRHRFWLACSLVTASAGCAGTGSGSLLSPPASVGSLKTSLSHMEYENRQLKSEVARLESDNRAVEDKLTQEESVNGELSARLDDARALLSERGGISSPDTAGSKTLPAASSNRKRRKPPFAQIPGRIDILPPEDDPGKADDLGPQSSHGGRSSQWVPVASDEIPAPPSVIVSGHEPTLRV